MQCRTVAANSKAYVAVHLLNGSQLEFLLLYALVRSCERWNVLPLFEWIIKTRNAKSHKYHKSIQIAQIKQKGNAVGTVDLIRVPTAGAKANPAPAKQLAKHQKAIAAIALREKLAAIALNQIL